ncbi:MAG: methyltransferase family protein, partial [Gammaproteobacteria bacterium]
RHPSYSGTLVTIVGFGLATTNWLSLLLVLACSLVGYSYRVHVEEQALCDALGEAYRDYMHRTRRFIPFVW